MDQLPKPSSLFYPSMIDDIQGVEILTEMALDLRWSWNRDAEAVWRQLDPIIWEQTKNPWIVLQTISREKLQLLLGNPSFRKQVENLIYPKNTEEEMITWFQSNQKNSNLTCVAYFSMEFMLGESLPIYSGGLGNVAGDQLKAASDLGLPVVGVGLLYQQGYFRQIIDKDGNQQALYPFNEPGQLPIAPVRHSNGELLRLELELPGGSVWLRAWHVRVGSVNLYLLDSNDAANFPANRGITSELYGAGVELRLKQELILGIGGWRLLTALGLKPEVCHLNEGHAAFAVLERAYRFMLDSEKSFEVALEVIRSGNLFTTHTAVSAGFDRFPPNLILQYLGKYAEEDLKISRHDLLSLGRVNPNDESELFNMAYLALRGSGRVNGVSRLHKEVSQRLFSPLFYRWPISEVPIGYVTNGVHIPTWESSASEDLWAKSCGKKRWLGDTVEIEKNIRCIPDVQLWKMRNTNRKNLIHYAVERLSRQLASAGFSSDAVESAKQLFNVDVLTMGFARRFATYKRPNLLLKDPQRLIRILKNPERPVQLIIAGKAHPADKWGQSMIQDWIRFIQQPEVRPHVIFLSDHDMVLAQHLVQGVDVWINTPRRPWEACGTSGMKTLVNGGINLSELDGWWVEAFEEDLGWAIGDSREHEDPQWDEEEARMLYDTLENEVIPEFYSRDENDIPTAWVNRMRESMARLTPKYSANRTVREYTEEHYLPAASNYYNRSKDQGLLGSQILDWKKTLKDKWSTIRFGEIKVESDEKNHRFEVQVYLNDLDVDSVRVSIFADGEVPVNREMHLERQLSGGASGYAYKGTVSATRPVGDYSIRLVPYFEGLAIPLEASYILWH